MDSCAEIPEDRTPPLPRSAANITNVTGLSRALFRRPASGSPVTSPKGFNYWYSVARRENDVRVTWSSRCAPKSQDRTSQDWRPISGNLKSSCVRSYNDECNIFLYILPTAAFSFSSAELTTWFPRLLLLFLTYLLLLFSFSVLQFLVVVYVR